MQAQSAPLETQTMSNDMARNLLSVTDSRVQQCLDIVETFGFTSEQFNEFVAALCLQSAINKVQIKSVSESEYTDSEPDAITVATKSTSNIVKSDNNYTPQVKHIEKTDEYNNQLDVRDIEKTAEDQICSTFQQKPVEILATPLEVVLKNKSISVSQINDSELLSELLVQKKPTRRTAVDVPQKVKGVRLEFSQTSKTLVIKGKLKGKAYRCVLDKWTIDETVSAEAVAKLLNQYIDVGIKLKRKPTTIEFKLHTQKLETIGDVMRAQIEFNINNTKGEGSNEWKKLEALMRNHMSKPKTVTLPNKQKRSIILADECLYGMTKANFECYLKEYEETNGTYDTIVSRVKAAINFCIDERLINQNDFFAFHQVARLGKERHVEVSDEDLKAMFNYLEEEPDQDFYFFMHLGITGHFRTSQTLSLKYSDFDFNHNLVKVEPKNGKFIEIPVAADIIELVKERQQQHIERFGKAEFLFPSPRSASGHRETFKDQWDDMRVELGFYHADADGNIAKDKNGKMMYKYRLHDFRETLLGRIHDLDDPTLAALLGHLSLHALKHYRKANRKRAEQGAKIANERLKAITTNN